MPADDNTPIAAIRDENEIGITSETAPAISPAEGKSAAHMSTHAAHMSTHAAPEGRLSAFDSPWLWLGVLVALGLLAPFVPVPSRAAALGCALVLTLVYVVSTVMFAAQWTRQQLAVVQTIGSFGAALSLWAFLQFMVSPLVADLFRALREEGDTPSGAQMTMLYAVRTLTDVSLLSAAVMGGSLVGRLIRSPNMMGPICAVVALIDVWGVLFGGIVSQLFDKRPQLAATAMASIPSVGSAVASTPSARQFHVTLPDIGAGDYLFLGLLFFALHFNHMNWRGAAKLTIPLMIAALLGVAAGAPAMPGLLFIGLGVALPNLKYFQFTREERFALLYAGIFVIILTVALYFGITSQLK